MEKKTRKRPMKKLEKDKERSVSFSKRRYGLFNKAAELFMLCDAQLAVLVSSPCSKAKRKIYSFGHPSVDVVLDAFLENQVPNVIDNKVKHRALSLLNETKGLESELKSTCIQIQRNKNSVASGFSSIFEGFESIEELQAVVDCLEKLIVKAKTRVSDPISCVLSNDNGDGDLQFVDDSSVTTNGFCTLNPTHYVSYSNINHTSPTASNDVFLRIQDSAFGYNFDSNNVLPIGINYNGLMGKQVDCNIMSNYVTSFGCLNGYNIVDGNSNSRQDHENWSWNNFISIPDLAANPCYNEPSSSDFGSTVTLDNAYQNQIVPAANYFEDLKDWLMS